MNQFLKPHFLKLLSHRDDATAKAPKRNCRNMKPWAVAMSCCMGLLISGCHDREADFKPSPELSKTALVRVLEDWQLGNPARNIDGASPAIHVTDSSRNPKQALEKFKILGEKPSRSGRTFAVELSLKHPDQQLKTEYIVVGIDPLLVFRREDFELLMHWDHRMPDLPAEAAKP